MFTGLIEAVCRIKDVQRKAEGLCLSLELGDVAKGTKKGDSISVNGVCLTVAELSGEVVRFDVSRETISKSTLGQLRPSSQVNVERALKASDRFGGHFVSGHVDGIAVIESINKSGEYADFVFRVEKDLFEQMVLKGSVAVDGVSLTIAGLDEGCFRVAVIPETLKRTTLGSARISDKVNIEIDIIVKTVRKYVKELLCDKRPLTIERLREFGFE